MIKYPTGVENHGGKLRLWFIYKRVRVREVLGVFDTPKNRKVAGELRASICFTIKTGCLITPNSSRTRFVANQMGHASAQMIYNVYGKGMTENNLDQIAILNAGFSGNAPFMPQTMAI